MARIQNDFQTIHSEGGLLPPDLLRRIINPKENIPGTRPEDYGLPQNERINETITQSWGRLCRHWAEFNSARKSLPESEAGTGLTNDRWNLPLLRELGFGILPTSPGPDINGRTYAINRFFGSAAIHLIGCNLSLDRRAAGVRGAAMVNPHGLVQEFLNRSQGHLWGILSNGLRLRIMRDNQALSRQSYLEFDLEAMFDGELFPDFVLLWLIAHATRFVPEDGAGAETCRLERWTKLAEEQGARALGNLRQGVEKALQILGQGFVGHPRNSALRDSLRDGRLSLTDFHGQLLRVVYRLIFLFVAEDRVLDGISLLHPRDDSEKGRQARERYDTHYSTARLRELASKIRGSRHGDLWQQFNLIVGALSGEERFETARKQLSLPVFGSMLWSPASTSALNARSLNGAEGAELSNFDFLDAIRHLAFTLQGKVLRPVDYKDIGAEEIGGVYESLLALTPQVSGDCARFFFAEFAGNERKTSGSYYTPDSLVQCLLDSALDPVVSGRLELAERVAKSEWREVSEEIRKNPEVRGYVNSILSLTPAEPPTEAEIARIWDSTPRGVRHSLLAEHAVLGMRVCDPAVGSGHFLVGAAHRLARHLARARALAHGESEASPLMYQHALRDVIGHCLYGVDISPMSAELCRVSLWLEALEPGKPLTFLDHHIRVGNSLLGCTPALLKAGIPDEAFSPIEGDDKAFCNEYKKKNKAERISQQHTLFSEDLQPWQHLGNLGAAMSRVDQVDDSTPEGLRRKTEAFEGFVRSSGYKFNRFVHDAWCAAFVFLKKKTDDIAYPITQSLLDRIERNPHDCPKWMEEEIQRLAEQYRFFHWHLEFPEVLGPEGQGGFDVVLGNPPWERVKLQEKEWFAERSPEIANAPNAAARKRLIEQLIASDPGLLAEFKEAQRAAEGESHSMRNSGLYPLCGRGDINLYAIFGESGRQRLSAAGRMGLVLPSGIATDDTTKFYFQDVVESGSLVSLYDFENRLKLFPDVDSRMKFCLFTCGSPLATRHSSFAGQAAEFVFFAHSVEDLADPERRFTLSSADIVLLNPNTRTCPIFRSKKDAELTKYIYRRVPVLVREARDGQPEENSWGIKFATMFHMSNDSHLFRTREQLEAEGWRLEGNIFKRGEERYLPLYEPKLLHQFEHRWATFEGVCPSDLANGSAADFTVDMLQNPWKFAISRYWVEKINIEDACKEIVHKWFIGIRGVTSTTNERTLIAASVPRYAAQHNLWLISFDDKKFAPVFLSLSNSIPIDYVTRLKMASYMSQFVVKQLPASKPSVFAHSCLWSNSISLYEWPLPRVLELTYTAWDLEPFAQDCGWSGPPFRWDEERRFLLRYELDAAFFHLYLGTQSEWLEKGTPELLAAFPTPRHAVEYIMETFPIVKRKDEAAHGCYRTKETILEIFDEMNAAARTGRPYQTRLDPPPADPSCCHAAREQTRTSITNK